MEVLYSSVSSEVFMVKIQTLIEQLRSSLPLDTIILSCSTCSSNFPLYYNGILRLKTILKKNLSTHVEEIIKILIENHETQKCPTSNTNFHQDIGIPDSICISFPESDTKYIGNLEVGNTTYKVETLIKTESENTAVFVLYQKVGAPINQYHDLINSNFHTFLNVMDEVEKDSDEKVHFLDDDIEYEYSSKRMIGGGRKINAPYNYQCLWCPEDDIQKGLKGRYLEIKNYRDHFRKCHMSEEGGGIPMSEFLSKVNRREPTWFCKNCRHHCSLSNMVRHKAVCYKNSNDESSSCSNQTFSEDTVADATLEDGQIGQSSSDEEESRKHFNYRRCLPPSKLDSSSDDESELHLIENEDQNKKDNSKSTQNDKPNLNDKNVNNEVSKTLMQNNKKAKVNIQKSAEFFEPDDEIDLTYSDDDSQTKPASVKVETEINQSDFDIDIEVGVNKVGPSMLKNNVCQLNKWWMNLPKEKYFSIDNMGPEFFCKEDTKDFIKTAMDKWSLHKAEKERLDKEMLEAESEEAEMLQFSLTRDKDFVTKYISFVSSFSAKDVLNLFSGVYESMDLPKGAKSSTAGQYGNRIIEFFKFMATKYHCFHLDWMLDYRGVVEKTYPDGNKTTDIFLPTMDDLREFIKTFRYGSNPAANCGLRIFALKKMIDFLIKEIKDHEHFFEGSIITKNKTVQCLVQNLKNLNEGICPDGTIKHIATASNKCHKRSLIEQMAKRPGRSIDSIMKGVREYVNSEEYNIQRTKLVELGCKKGKVPTMQEYTNSTNWLLEQLICLGGNRPCALFGITVKDWEEKQPGYCPFDQDETNEMIQDDPTNDQRKVLKNPFKKPKGEDAKEPTGFIVNSETDKISVNSNQPCYIWFPNAIVDLVNNHSLMAQKILPRAVDLYHPNTRLFLNINGNSINKLDCRHFKNYIGLPITAYDFRRSLSTFCLDSNLEGVKNSESAVLRHRQETGYAYYYQKHGEKVEYVNIQYALNHGLVKASGQAVDEYCASLRKGAMNEEWELAQKRSDKALEYHQLILEKRKEGLQNARQKGSRNWILPNEYDAFINGIEEAIRIEEKRQEDGLAPGPFFNIINYKPDKEGAGIFPPTRVWQIDMYRILYGLVGEKGEEMRKADLSVYNGVPFSKGYTGRKKIGEHFDKHGVKKQSTDWVVADYWREKIRKEALQILNGKWKDLRFIFTKAELEYHNWIKDIKTELN